MSENAPTTPPPVNPNASPEVRALLDYLYRISGHALLSGQHNTPMHLSQYSDEAAQITGKYPALWGQDFGFTADGMDGIIYRPAIIEEAKRQHAAGSVITLMWHAVRPMDAEPGNWEEHVNGKIIDTEWADITTPGTPLHARWLAQVDVVAGYLAELRDARIPVLWRPYHEMNGGWFWWGKRGGPEGYQALWKNLWERFVHVHRLDNLLWVWNANAPDPWLLPYPDCYPGPEWVDILATDVYRNDYRQSHYDDLLTLADGKPVALGEVGPVPTPTILDAQPRWAWFMVWTNFLTRENSPETVRALYQDSRTLGRPIHF